MCLENLDFIDLSVMNYLIMIKVNVQYLKECSNAKTLKPYTYTVMYFSFLRYYKEYLTLKELCKRQCKIYDLFSMLRSDKSCAFYNFF